MFLVTITALVAVCGADRLDRTYLPPPPSVKLSGGSPGSLQAPFVENNVNQGQRGLPKGAYTNDLEGVVVDAVAPGTRASSPDETNLGAPRPSYGSVYSKVGIEAFRPDPIVGFRDVPGVSQSGFTKDKETNNGQNGQHHFETRPVPGVLPTNDQRTQSAHDRVAETIRSESAINHDGYMYSFETDNGISVEENAIEAGGMQAQGSYTYKSDDGQTYSVTYTADSEGFKPKGDHLPTPPPIPDAILKSLEQNAKEEAAGMVDDGSYDAQKYNTGSDYNNKDISNKQYNNHQLVDTQKKPESDINRAPFNQNNQYSGSQQFGGVQYGQGSSNVLGIHPAGGPSTEKNGFVQNQYKQNEKYSFGRGNQYALPENKETKPLDMNQQSQLIPNFGAQHVGAYPSVTSNDNHQQTSHRFANVPVISSSRNQHQGDFKNDQLITYPASNSDQNVNEALQMVNKRLQNQNRFSIPVSVIKNTATQLSMFGPQTFKAQDDDNMDNYSEIPSFFNNPTVKPSVNQMPPQNIQAQYPYNNKGSQLNNVNSQNINNPSNQLTTPYQHHRQNLQASYYYNQPHNSFQVSQSRYSNAPANMQNSDQTSFTAFETASTAPLPMSQQYTGGVSKLQTNGITHASVSSFGSKSQTLASPIQRPNFIPLGSQSVQPLTSFSGSDNSNSNKFLLSQRLQFAPENVGIDKSHMILQQIDSSKSSNLPFPSQQYTGELYQYTKPPESMSVSSNNNKDSKSEEVYEYRKPEVTLESSSQSEPKQPSQLSGVSTFQSHRANIPAQIGQNTQSSVNSRRPSSQNMNASLGKSQPQRNFASFQQNSDNQQIINSQNYRPLSNSNVIKSPLLQSIPIKISGKENEPNNENQQSQFKVRPLFNQKANSKTNEPCCLGHFGQRIQKVGSQTQEQPLPQHKTASDLNFEKNTSETVVGQGEVFSGPREPPRFDASGYYY